MSKSILIVDTPKNCKHCHFRIIRYYNLVNFDFWCMANGKIFDDLNKKFQPTNFRCPLKPLPQKKELNHPTTDSVTTIIEGEYTLNNYLCDKGYNQCLDEILGGESE